jgi:hypothetical protein
VIDTNSSFLSKVQKAVAEGLVFVTNHAKDEADNDILKYDQISYSVLRGEIIEDYPLDRPYPSCLIYGRTESDVPVHSVWAFNEGTGYAVLITVYRPDPDKWNENKERKK